MSPVLPTRGASPFGLHKQIPGLTIRRVKGEFIVTAPDIEPVTFKSRRDAKDWCLRHYRGLPIQRLE